MKDIYTSTLFKLSLKYARKLEPDSIFVLSAKHGLLPLEKVIEPYEETLKNKRAGEIEAWAKRVLDQIKAICPIDQTEFILLAGERYRKYLLPHIEHSEIPLEGLRIGEQLQKLKGLVL